jgi:hypothetical protein
MTLSRVWQVRNTTPRGKGPYPSNDPLRAEARPGFFQI